MTTLTQTWTNDMLVGPQSPRYENYLVFTSKSASSKSKIAGMKELATIYDRFLKNDPIPARQAPDTRTQDILTLPKLGRGRAQDDHSKGDKRGLHGLPVSQNGPKRQRNGGGSAAPRDSGAEKIPKSNPPLTNNQTAKVWPILDTFDYPHCCPAQLVSLALAGKQTFSCNQSRCKEFHVGDKVKGYADGIPPPTSAMLTELGSAVHRVFLPKARGAGGRGGGRGGSQRNSGRGHGRGGNRGNKGVKKQLTAA